MRNDVSAAIAAVVALLAFAPSVMAQTGNAGTAEGWLAHGARVRRTSAGARRARRGRPSFDPHDLSGIWGDLGMELNVVVPPLTARGKELYDATRAEEAPGGLGLAVSN